MTTYDRKVRIGAQLADGNVFYLGQCVLQTMYTGKMLSDGWMLGPSRYSGIAEHEPTGATVADYGVYAVKCGSPRCYDARTKNSLMLHHLFTFGNIR